MKKIVLSTVALFAMTSFAAAAEPLRLTDAQMDNVTAGQPTGLIVIDRTDVAVAVPVNAAVAANVCVIAGRCTVDDTTAVQRPGRIIQ